jgi:uncharacterized protein (TIGR02145 family)
MLRGNPKGSVSYKRSYRLKTAVRQRQWLLKFSALPGGYRNNDGNFNNIGNNGNWWSATENNASNAYNRNLNYDNDNLNRNNNNKGCGFSVRLLRDLKGNRKPCGSNPAWCFYL